MPATETTAAAEITTTLTTARQSSQLLKLLRSVLQGSTPDLRRYLDRGGDPNARLYHTPEDGKVYVSSEEHTGSSALLTLSLLAACCASERSEQKLRRIPKCPVVENIEKSPMPTRFFQLTFTGQIPELLRDFSESSEDPALTVQPQKFQWVLEAQTARRELILAKPLIQITTILQ